MARRRGFFAELQHQAAVSARERARAQAAAGREQARLAREMERAQRAAAQAQRQLERSDTAAAKAAKKEFERLHIAAREAEVEALNAQLAQRLSEIDNVLLATLKVDDYVDLERLRKSASHPAFVSPHATPIPSPAPMIAPPEPTFTPPDQPKGIGAFLGGRKKYEAALTASRQAFQAEHDAWSSHVRELPMRQLAQLEAHAAAEAERLRRLEADQAAYRQECDAREQQIAAENAALDALIQGLAQGRQEAVEEYLGIVLGNSVYPDELVSVSDYSYDAATKELTISLSLPRPDELPAEREFKYTKAKDEISAVAQPPKEQRQRYADLVGNSALRTMHEVWESDRHGHVKTISLTGIVEHVDAATGKDARTTLIAVAASRDLFEQLDLSRIKVADTLRHLNADLSKEMHALVPIGSGTSVRGH